MTINIGGDDQLDGSMQYMIKPLAKIETEDNPKFSKERNHSPLLPRANNLNISHLGGGRMITDEERFEKTTNFRNTSMDVSFKRSFNVNPLEIGKQAFNWK